MKHFSIADVASFSSVKAHTLRVWENRFTVIKPNRSLGNVRNYTLDEVDQLLKLTLLNKAGIKISRLAAMGTSAIEAAVLSLVHEDDKQCLEINKLIISMYSMDIEKFDQVLDNCQMAWGIDKTIKEIIIPFLEKTELFSCKHCESVIDFAVTSIRKKIIYGIEKAIPSTQKQISVLLFLMEGDHFDLLLLYFNYIIKSNGIKVLYMGTNISFEKLASVLQIKQPDYLITCISRKQNMKVREMKDFLQNSPSTLIMLAAGFQAAQTTQPIKNLRFIHYRDLSQSLSD